MVHLMDLMLHKSYQLRFLKLSTPIQLIVLPGILASENRRRQVLQQKVCSRVSSTELDA